MFNSLWFQNPKKFDDDFDSNLALDTNYSNIEIESIIRASYELNFGTQKDFELFIGNALNKLNDPESKKNSFLN